MSALKPSGRLYLAIVLMWDFRLDYPSPRAPRSTPATDAAYSRAMRWLEEFGDDVYGSLENDLFEYNPLEMDSLDGFSRREVTNADYEVRLVWTGVLDSTLVAAIAENPASMYASSFEEARKATDELLTNRCASIDDARRASQKIIAESNDPLQGVIELWGVWKAALAAPSTR